MFAGRAVNPVYGPSRFAVMLRVLTMRWLFYAPELKAGQPDCALDPDPGKIVRRPFGRFDDAVRKPRRKLMWQLAEATGAIVVLWHNGQ